MTQIAEKNRSISVTIFAVVFLTLFLTAFKNDADAFAVNLDWNGLTLHPLIAAVKHHSSLAMIPLLILAAYAIYSTGGTQRAYSTLAIFICIASLYMCVYNYVIGSQYILKYAEASSILIFLYVFSVKAIHRVGPHEYANQVKNGLLAIACTITISNLINYLTGYGFVPDFSRMFGTAAHPNFLGVQLAIGMLVMLDRLFTPRLIMRIFLIVMMAASFKLILETGSRTALMMLAIGSTVYAWAKMKYSVTGFILVLSGLSLAFAIFYLKGGLDAGNDGSVATNTFYRGETGDTRSEVWELMWQEIQQSPVFGVGPNADASENSFLRAWATYGFFYCAYMTVLVLLSTLSLMFWSQRKPHSHPIVFGSIAVALIAGSIFEGFFVDSFTFPIICWFFMCTTASEADWQAYIIPNFVRKRRLDALPLPQRLNLTSDRQPYVQGPRRLG